jgi:hypothetical protein
VALVEMVEDYATTGGEANTAYKTMNRSGIPGCGKHPALKFAGQWNSFLCRSPTLLRQLAALRRSVRKKLLMQIDNAPAAARSAQAICKEEASYADRQRSCGSSLRSVDL